MNTVGSTTFVINFLVPLNTAAKEVGFTIIIVSSPFDSIITFYPMNITNYLPFTQNVLTTGYSIFVYLTGLDVRCILSITLHSILIMI